MVRWSRISVVLGAVVVLASGCGDMDNPLAPPARPALQEGGGHTIGGNVTDGGGTTTTTSITSATAPSDTTSRGGGHTVGGN